MCHSDQPYTTGLLLELKSKLTACIPSPYLTSLVVYSLWSYFSLNFNYVWGERFIKASTVMLANLQSLNVTFVYALAIICVIKTETAIYSLKH